MSEIKPVYLRLSKFHELEVCHGSIEGAELYYPAVAYEAQAKRIAELEARTLDIPEGYKAILVLNEYAPPTPDYNECYRNADLATGVTHRCKSWVSVFIREINRWCYQRDDQHKSEIESLRKQVEELKLAHQYQVNLNLKNG